jgi:hypothetical protein
MTKQEQIAYDKFMDDGERRAFQRQYKKDLETRRTFIILGWTMLTLAVPFIATALNQRGVFQTWQECGAAMLIGWGVLAIIGTTRKTYEG